jgi:hypothetical protein
MRYFTRGWANGELGDAGEQIAEAYRRRLDEITPRLPESARVLAREINLHDAIIERVRWCPATRELSLELVAHVDRAGYRTIALTYLGALLGEQRLETLRMVARDRETEILYDEVDIDDDDNDDLLVHRLLFWPRDELTIDFRELRLEVTPRDDKRVTLGGAFVEVQPADDDTSEPG